MFLKIFTQSDCVKVREKFTTVLSPFKPRSVTTSVTVADSSGRE